VKLYFTLASSATYGDTTVVDLDGYGGYSPTFSSLFATYQPRVTPGAISVYLARGDVDGITGINISDVTYLVDYLFNGGPLPLPVLEAGDVNCEDGTNIGDLTYLVDYLFRGGPPPCEY